jgi:RES domain-containing protein
MGPTDARPAPAASYALGWMPLAMTKYTRDEVACHFCFRDKTLQTWIKEEHARRGVCPWCRRRGHLVPLSTLGEVFREVAELYVPSDGPYAFERGELLSVILDDDWQVFSERIQVADLAQELAIAILHAGLTPKERYEYPDYEGLFQRKESSLEETWDRQANRVLSNGISTLDDEGAFSAIATDLPSRMEIAFEDLAISYPAGDTFFRARIYDDRHRKERFVAHEVGAPPADTVKAGRANSKGQPVLYLASNKSTALAEVRPWKGAAVALAEVKLKRRLLLVDLSRTKPVETPFFVELLRWRVELAELLFRLAQDMSRPVPPHEEEVLYGPTQLLARQVKANGYDGCIYPSAMGPGINVVLFNPEDAEVGDITHVRVLKAAYFSAPLSPYEPIFDEGPYDHAVKARAKDGVARNGVR